MNDILKPVLAIFYTGEFTNSQWEQFEKIDGKGYTILLLTNCKIDDAKILLLPQHEIPTNWKDFVEEIRQQLLP